MIGFAVMSKRAASLNLTSSEKAMLEQWVRAGTSEKRLVERARIILLTDQGLTTRQIAQSLDTRLARVSKWRQRFLRLRLEGLQDRARSGKPARYDQNTERRVLEQLDQPPPAGQAT